MTIKTSLLAPIVLMAGVFYTNTTSATEYIYRDLMANTLPSVCAKEEDAMANAAKSYNLNKYSKKFCQSQGYGWHVEAIKDNGKTVCRECSTSSASAGKKQCHLEDVVVSCKRIKPGSVGLLPGQS